MEKFLHKDDRKIVVSYWIGYYKWDMSISMRDGHPEGTLRAGVKLMITTNPYYDPKQIGSKRFLYGAENDNCPN